MSRLGSLKQTLEVATTVAMLCAALTVGWKAWFPVSKQKAPPPATSVDGLTIDAKAVSNVMGEGTVAVVEFSDFQCPYCEKYASETWPLLRREFVDRGKIKYIAMHYPLTNIHPMAFQASQAAECAAKQGQFWQMHDRLFEAKALSRPDLDEHAERLGLNKETFSVCLEQEETRQAIRADMAEGARLGVKGTPMFFIGLVQPDGNVKLTRKIQGAASFQTLRTEIESALASHRDSQRVTALNVGR